MSTAPAVPQVLLDIAQVVLPAVDLSGCRLAQGQFHDVVLIPEVAAVRIARRPATAAHLPRRTALLQRLSEVGLPFLVPVPLSDPVTVNGHVAVAVSWLPGRPLPKGVGDPHELGSLLGAIREVPLSHLAGLLDAPHAYAGRENWLCLLLQEVIPALPARQQREARRRVEEAVALPHEKAVLVHGDLAGDNLHWDEDGHLIGVLDWDLAQPFDHAVDVACLATQGWENVRQAVTSDVFARARVWARTFGLEQLASAIASGEPKEVLDQYLNRTVQWLDAETPLRTEPSSHDSRAPDLS